jgi:signal transduction histidine kinase
VKLGNWNRKLWVTSLALAGALGFAPGAAAQSCALCYTTASAAGSAGIHALHVGILALLIPALALFLWVFALVFHGAGRSEL